MTLNTKIKILFSSSVFLLFSWFILLWGNISAQANDQKVPVYYYADYEIEKDRSRLQEIFVDIDAGDKFWELSPWSLYAEQNQIMKRLFKYFPKDQYTFEVTYQQCLKSTEIMSKDPTRENFQSYYENCKAPLAQVNTNITTKYTVKASASANPSNWSAPITVTFDARASRDPSLETIPTNNYFWYYRDVDGIDKTIWIGPVVKHTFTEEWTYIVHCTVRSSNYWQWIMDWTANLTVNVSPQSAIISIYANGKKMEKNKITKIGVQEAKKWVFIDWSATSPRWWREILSHSWTIVWRDGFRYTKSWDWSPSYINVSLPSEGEYTVTLSVNDNERNTVSAKYTIWVSDPVAIVQQSPEKWTTSTTYTFSANSSYSLTSRLKLYTWEIFDTNAIKMDTVQGKSIKKQFKKPWNYTVKLTVEDEMWLRNSDTVNVYVESTSPKPQFTITPTNKWKYPSEYYLDASSSSDVDVGNGYDSLTYEWWFSNPSVAEVTETEDDNKKVTVRFNEIGNHTITLRVLDKYWKISEIQKRVNVTSILRPVLTINPKAAVWDTYIGNKVTSNVPLMYYEWTFWDGNTPRKNETNQLTHNYKKTGIYTVKVVVTDTEWNINEVSDKVFIWEKDYPIPAYTVKNSRNQVVIETENICTSTGADWEVIAHNWYLINRQEQFTIDTSDSVNAQGTKTNLKYHFQVQEWDIYTKQQFNYKFNTMGCRYIKYTLEDTSLNKKDEQIIYFKVVNALPTLDNLFLSYPQYGNEIWIGFSNENNTQDILSTADFDPLIVKVTASNPRDPDWSISYFKWKYYPTDNPAKILEMKVTPWTIPYTFFTIPRQPWDFTFEVELVDNDWGSQSSDDILSRGPWISFPPDSSQPDIPIVTLKSNKSTADVWETVTFDVISKVISDRSDFIKERTIQIDVDWDWTWEYIGKDDRFDYQYTKPSPAWHPYIPKAAVTYRDYKWIGEGNEVVIRNWLRPNLIYTAIWKTIIFKDISLWDIIEREICFDTSECAKGNAAYIRKDSIDTNNIESKLDRRLKIIYPAAWTYEVTIKVKDKNWNEKENTINVLVPEKTKIQPIDEGLYFITLPDNHYNQNWVPEIIVGSQLKNEVLFFLKSDANINNCYIDADINTDKYPEDWDASNDKDFGCNQIYIYEYTPSYESTMWRIYYQKDGEKGFITKDFIVTFSEFEKNLSEDDRIYYNLITELITTINDKNSVWNWTLRALLLNLKNDIANWDKNAQRSDILQINEFLWEKSTKLTKKQTEKLNEVITWLTDYVIVSPDDTYLSAKLQILGILPSKLKTSVEKWFNKLESIEWDNTNDVVEEKRKWLETIDGTISNKVAKSSDEWGEDEIDSLDYTNIVKPNICVIAKELGIQTKICNDEYKTDDKRSEVPSDTTIGVDNSTSTKSGMPKWIKVLLLVVGIVVVWFVWLIAVFAIKAKMREDWESDDEE